MIKMKRGVWKLVLGISLICLVKMGSGLGLLGKEGDFEYCRRTTHDEYGRLTELYESIRIPAVTREIEGRTVIVTPEYFEARIFRPNIMHAEGKLGQVLSNDWNNWEWEHQFDYKEVQKQMRNTPRGMAESSGNLQQFMNRVGVSPRYEHCMENVYEPIYQFGKKLNNFERDIDEIRKKIKKIDKTPDLIEQIQKRQEAISKIKVFRENDKKYIKTLEDWNRGACGQAAGKLHGLSEMRIKNTDLRKYKDRKKHEIDERNGWLDKEIKKYNNLFRDFERERNEFNEQIKKIQERSQSAQISEEDLSQMWDKANTLESILLGLKRMARELHLDNERKEFEETEKKIKEARNKVEEAKKREKEEAKKRRKAREEENSKQEKERKDQEDKEREEKESQKREEQEKSDQEARDREDERLRQEAERDRKKREQEEKDQQEAERLKEEKDKQEQQEIEEKEFINEIDGVQFEQNLTNLDMMFNGELAPDMNVLYDVLSAFDREDIYGEEGYILNDMDLKMAGDFSIATYEYRDDTYGVAMNIGQVRRVKGDGISFEQFSVMNVRGINVESESGMISIAFDGGDRKVMLESDFESIENFIGQRRAQEMVYLNSNSHHIPNVEPEKLKIWGLEKETVEKIRSITSLVADFLPYVGTSKGFSELIFGHDYVGGEDVNRVVALCGVVGSFIPIPGAAKGGKLLARVVIKIIKKASDGEDKVPSNAYGKAWDRTKNFGRKIYGRKAEKLEGNRAGAWKNSGEVLEGNIDVWRLKPIDRGIEIENRVAKTDYHDCFRAGQANNGKFPLIDFQKGNVLVSLKTVDTRSKGWFNRMAKHIRALGESGATVSDKPAKMKLDIRVQPGGLDVKKLASLKKIGEEYDVEIKMLEFK